MAEKKGEIVVRSSAAEYLTFVASTGESDESFEMRYEEIYERADADKEHMGLTTWENAPDGKIVKADVTIVKNYLSEEEMSYLERTVSLYLDYAQLQAERKIPMSMEDWAKRLDGFLEFNGNELLTSKECK
jgi:hypothetical protein